ncbi:hypothetical protein GOODEAATRI_015107, partial [Goodea atripinnis]
DRLLNGIFCLFNSCCVLKGTLSAEPAAGHYAGQPGLLLRPRHGSLPADLEMRYLQCTCCWRSQVPVAGFETLNAALTSSSPLSSEPCKEEHSRSTLDTCYTSEQRDTILQLLNNATSAELAGVKLLRGRKSLNIVDYRTKHGPFKTLESVVNVPLLKHKSAVIVFNSILNPEKKERKVRVQLAKFIRPEVDRSWLEVSSVVSVLPSADFYLIEKPSISVQNTTLFPVMAHMRTVEAMLFALLEPRISPPEPNIPPRVLNMIRIAVGRHFDLIVGEARTSGAQVVRQLMTESVTQKFPRINVPQELLAKYRNYFQMGSRRGGEELCDALLQAVAFYELLSESSS